MTDLKNRSEILFLYDIQNANPNGDPNDENKPRIDEETGKNIVTDVRLKRTIRDYLMEEKNQEIFVREIADEEGKIQDAKLRADDFLPKEKIELEKMTFQEQRNSIANAILSQCIDVRLFGATIPLDLKVKGKNITSSVTFTGPVQFKMGKSLHSVKIQHIKGTGAFASKAGATQKTFREEYILPYSLIAFYGVVNENAAKYTELKHDDVQLLKEAIWHGTKGLITRSKFGQMPRLLLVINYNLPNFFIGDLDNLIELYKGELRDEELRKPEDYKLGIGALLDKIENHLEKIENVEFITDPRMRYLKNGEPIELKNLDKFAEISL
jgi:CRISPR-associated protein Csh2